MTTEVKEINHRENLERKYADNVKKLERLRKKLENVQREIDNLEHKIRNQKKHLEQ